MVRVKWIGVVGDFCFRRESQYVFVSRVFVCKAKPVRNSPQIDAVKECLS